MTKVTQSEKDLVFIVSGGRTGTRFLGDELSSVIDQCFSVHEPDLIKLTDISSFRRLQKRGLWKGVFAKLAGQGGIRTIGTRLVKQQISRSTAILQIAKSRNSFHKKITQPLIVESNAQWHLACEEISTIWPEAKILIIIRDPRSWIRSWLNKGTRWRISDIPRWLPPGRPTPRSTKDEEWKVSWNSFGAFERLAWEWRFVYSRLDKCARENVNARVFRFEDLFTSGDQTQMRALLSFCSRHPEKQYNFAVPVDFTSEKKNQSGGVEQEWEAWSDYRCRIVDELCGPLMRRYRYGLEAEWVKRVHK